MYLCYNGCRSFLATFGYLAADGIEDCRRTAPVDQESFGGVRDQRRGSYRDGEGRVRLVDGTIMKGGELGKRNKESNAEISALRPPIERVVSHFKSWWIFHTDCRRPYSTYRDAYHAPPGLFFFSITCTLNNAHSPMKGESSSM